MVTTVNDDRGPVANETQDSLTTQDILNSANNSTQADISSATNPTPIGAYDALPGLRNYNPLDEFSSYAYKLTLYMVSPDSYNRFILSEYTDTNGFYIVAQDGGSGPPRAESPLLSTERAPGFDTDYYIDNLKITSLINSKETRSPTNSYEYKFDIIEPSGFSFIKRLNTASKVIQLSSKVNAGITNDNNNKSTVVALNQVYVIAVRFYGYDATGALITGDNFVGSDVNRTDQSAVFEKYFTVRLISMKFRLDGKTTVYSVEAAEYNTQQAFDIKRGMVKSPVSITGSTVGEMLAGQTGSNTNGVKGLVDVLNANEQQLVKTKQVDIANQYFIEFEPNSPIEAATLVNKTELQKDKTPLNKVTNTLENNPRTAKKSAVMQPQVREKQFGQGTSIIQIIDQVVSQSSYIEQSMNKVYDEDVQTAGLNNTTPKDFSWYNITPRVEVLGWDDKRKDFAYKITYLVKIYKVVYVPSPTANKASPYYGAHKKYYYYFTGKNTSIINYEQTYNLLYQNVVNSTGIEGYNDGTSGTIPTMIGGSAVADPTGKKGLGTETVNASKNSLYSPKDQLQSKLTIIGDPDLMTTSTAAPLIDTFLDPTKKRFYGKGLELDASGGQIFIEVIFNEAIDYNNETGLMELNDQIQFLLNYDAQVEAGIRGVVHMVTKVYNRFERGKFTQELVTTLPSFLDPNAQSAAEQRPAETNTGPTESDLAANTARKSFAATDPRRTDVNPDFKEIDPYKQQRALRPPQILTPTPGQNLTTVNDDAGGQAVYSPLGDVYFDTSSRNDVSKSERGNRRNGIVEVLNSPLTGPL